jgi:hypothetical protein
MPFIPSDKSPSNSHLEGDFYLDILFALHVYNDIISHQTKELDVMRGFVEVLKASELPSDEPIVNYQNMTIDFYDLALGRAGNVSEPYQEGNAFDWTAGPRKPSEVASMIIASYELQGLNFKSKIEINGKCAYIKMLRTVNPVIKNSIQVTLN